MVVTLLFIECDVGERFLSYSQSVVVNSKPKKTRITFDTRVKSALLKLVIIKTFRTVVAWSVCGHH